jgi:conjugal transfer pilus assembly protein TraD
LISKVKAEDLLGLTAQMSVLINSEIGPLLIPTIADQDIDLRRALDKREIVFFQLDSLANPDTARRIGRMIIEDIKGLASYVYRNTEESKRQFVPVFLDEFGSFASKEFVDLLKQVRGAKIGMHLFAQGLEDLDAINPAFRRQVASNPLIKIALRLDDPQTVNEFTSMIGTHDAIEESYQKINGVISQYSPVVSVKKVKQMRVEHDVLKNLRVGEMVVVNKSKSQLSLVRGMN